MITPDFPPAADAVVFAPSEDLVDLPVEVRANEARKRARKPKGWQPEPGIELFDGHEGLLVRTVLVRSQAYPQEKTPVVIGSPYDVFKLCSHMRMLDQEHIVLIAVNRNNEVTAIYEAAKGSATGAGLEARDLLKIPLLTGSAAFFVVHNHPSGTATPSPEDVQMTRAIEAAASCIGLALLDHVIVAGETGRQAYLSFVDRGLLDRGEP
jgi:hypothetical protein